MVKLAEFFKKSKFPNIKQIEPEIIIENKLSETVNNAKQEAFIKIANHMHSKNIFTDEDLVWHLEQIEIYFKEKNNGL